MPIPVVCPSCGNNISAPDHVAGRTLRCFKCLNPFTVPNVAPTPKPVAPMAQLAPSFQPAPPPMPTPAFEASAPPHAPAPTFEPSPDDMAAALFEEAPPSAPAPPSSPTPIGSGPDPFELTQEEPAFDAAASPITPQEELPSTQDMPLEEAPLEMSATDEMELPAEEAPMEEAPEEAAEEPEQPRKSRKVALLLSLFPFSIHRFYLGYTKSAIVQILLYFVVIGYVWWVFDFLRLLFGIGFKKDGRGVPLR